YNKTSNLISKVSFFQVDPPVSMTKMLPPVILQFFTVGYQSWAFATACRFWLINLVGMSLPPMDDANMVLQQLKYWPKLDRTLRLLVYSRTSPHLQPRLIP